MAQDRRQRDRQFGHRPGVREIAEIDDTVGQTGFAGDHVASVRSRCTAWWGGRSAARGGSMRAHASSAAAEIRSACSETWQMSSPTTAWPKRRSHCKARSSPDDRIRPAPGSLARPAHPWRPPPVATGNRRRSVRRRPGTATGARRSANRRVLLWWHTSGRTMWPWGGGDSQRRARRCDAVGRGVLGFQFDGRDAGLAILSTATGSPASWTRKLQSC